MRPRTTFESRKHSALGAAITWLTFLATCTAGLTSRSGDIELFQAEETSKKTWISGQRYQTLDEFKPEVTSAGRMMDGHSSIQW